MNKAETKKDARRMLESAETEFKQVCQYVGACLMQELYQENALLAVPHLLNAWEHLESMRKDCKFRSDESAISVRNSWMHALFRAKQVRDEIETIRMKYIVFN